MIFLTFVIMILSALSLAVWLAISLLILYNLYYYTDDKRNLRKDMPVFLRKYVPFL